MSIKLYDTDLSDAAWALVAPVLPAARPGGRPRTTDVRAVVNAIFYLLRTGCQWRLMAVAHKTRRMTGQVIAGPWLAWEPSAADKARLRLAQRPGPAFTRLGQADRSFGRVGVCVVGLLIRRAAARDQALKQGSWCADQFTKRSPDDPPAA